jgi:hypothetical protein
MQTIQNKETKEFVMKRNITSILLLMALGLPLISGCTALSTTTPQLSAPTEAAKTEPTSPVTESTAAPQNSALAFNNSAWNYDSANDVYWQIGVQYSAKPETLEYETLGIYVPGTYMTATDNGNGTYSATLNKTGSINGFTAKTAPMVFPVNTPGYMAAKAPIAYNYDEVSSYLKAGFIYVQPGVRGRANGYDASGKLTYSGGAPWGVTDFKAAVRFIRYNKAVLPGNTDSIFAFGMSGGGAQTSIIGASGDSQLYFPYLESIGAIMKDDNGQPISDAVTGAMAWCPITSLDYADEAYEWNMGQYSTSGTRADGTFTSALSKDLATAYADYINKLGIKDESGNVLVLTQSDAGIYAAGSYYDYLMKTIETSLNNFLADTKFPYTETSGGFPGGPGGGTPPMGEIPQNGNPPAGAMPQGGMPGGNGAPAGTSTTYQTVQEYFAALNKDSQWVAYDPATNTAKVTSLAGFVNNQKNPSKSVGAFDGLDRSAGENDVFGNDENDSLHFDSVLDDLLAQNQTKYATYSDWNASYVDAFATDLKTPDKLGGSIQYRVNMYNPMYYLLPYYEGYQTSTVAQYWRINTGIKQGDTANTVEMNLALALENYNDVKDVKFTTVWGQGHTMAERTGDSTDNFIAWVTEVAQK